MSHCLILESGISLPNPASKLADFKKETSS
jgi:hypothetical protein